MSLSKEAYEALKLVKEARGIEPQSLLAHSVFQDNWKELQGRGFIQADWKPWVNGKSRLRKCELTPDGYRAIETFEKQVEDARLTRKAGRASTKTGKYILSAVAAGLGLLALEMLRRALGF